MSKGHSASPYDMTMINLKFDVASKPVLCQ